MLFQEVGVRVRTSFPGARQGSERVVGKGLHYQQGKSSIAIRNGTPLRDASGSEDRKRDQPLCRFGRDRRAVAALIGIDLGRRQKELAGASHVRLPHEDQAKVVEGLVESRIEIHRFSKMPFGNVDPLLLEVDPSDQVVHLGRRTQRERAFEMDQGLAESALDGVQPAKSVMSKKGVLSQGQRPFEVQTGRLRFAVITAHDTEHQRNVSVSRLVRRCALQVVSSERRPAGKEKVLAEELAQGAVRRIEQQRFLETPDSAPFVASEHQLHSVVDEPIERRPVGSAIRERDLSRPLLEPVPFVEFFRIAVDQLSPAKLDCVRVESGVLLEQRDHGVEQSAVVEARVGLPMNEVQQAIVARSQLLEFRLQRRDALQDVLLDSVGLGEQVPMTSRNRDDVQLRPAPDA